MKVAKKKSDLMNSIQASTPVVWLQTKEDNRIVKNEIYELLRKGVSKQAYIYNALDQLSESAHPPQSKIWLRLVLKHRRV